MVKQSLLTIETRGRGFYPITTLINDYVVKSTITEGICTLFLSHTSASLVLCENADEKVKKDLEQFFQNLVPDSESLYAHNSEGRDDMPAHIRTVLTKSDLTLPIRKGLLKIGTWQGVYVWEHRKQGHSRHITLTIIGE